MSSSTQRAVLSEALRARLSTATVGAGGYQTLVHEIQKKLDGATLLADEDLVERIEHYAFDFGSGDWQQLLRDLLGEIESSAARS